MRNDESGLILATTGSTQMKKKRPFDFRQLQTFEHLCRTGSFTQTAKYLFVTQSAVSHSIKSLEQEAGCKLIEKKGKKIILTGAGERLLEFAKPVLSEMESIREEIATHPLPTSNRLRIGASEQICRFILPNLLAEYLRGEPLHKFEVRSMDTLGCLNSLSKGDIDLALTVEPYHQNDYRFVPCFSDELMLVLPKDHKWALERKVSWADGENEFFILPDAKGYTYHVLNEYFAELKIKISTTIEMNDTETSKELIRRGIGIGIMPDWAIESEVKKQKLIALPLGPKRLIRAWGVTFASKRRLSQLDKKFIQCVERIGCRWMVNRTLSIEPSD
jgi:DNA-binding transcriptional LysR family regulator